MRKTSKTAIVLTSGLALAANAQIAVYDFEAQITSISDASELLLPTNISTTDRVTGRIRYDVGAQITPFSPSEPTIGLVSSFGSMFFDVESSTGTRRFGDPDGSMQLYENNRFFGDGFAFNGNPEIIPADIVSLLDGGPALGGAIGQLQVFFRAPSSFDDALEMPSELTLAGYSNVSFTISGFSRDNGSFAIRGELTSIALVPAPSAAVAMGMLSIAGTRRRR
ncbi:MAG: hypothetical protein AAF747_10290 [Planctomycetota bacterium]